MIQLFAWMFVAFAWMFGLFAWIFRLQSSMFGLGTWMFRLFAWMFGHGTWMFGLFAWMIEEQTWIFTGDRSRQLILAHSSFWTGCVESRQFIVSPTTASNLRTSVQQFLPRDDACKLIRCLFSLIKWKSCDETVSYFGGS